MSRYNTFKVGQYIWHGSRYWKQDGPLAAHEVQGWHTKYVAWQIVKITAQRIVVDNAAIGESLHLKRRTMENKGKQYHTRYHEYFYAYKPLPGTKDWNWAGSSLNSTGFQAPSASLQTLGLTQPYTRKDAQRAYRRLAKTAHPDKGGSSQEFTKLKTAYDTALRFASA